MSFLSKNVCLVLFILLTGACSDAPESPAGDRGIPDRAIVTEYEDVPGLSYAVVKNGERIIEEGDVLKGVKHGSWTVYNNDGMVSTVTTYYQGKKQGTHIEIDHSGYIVLKATYANGVLDGAYFTYRRNRITEERFYVNGKLEGVQKKYYNDGKLMEESTYVNGKLDGLSRWYDQQGQLSFAYEYEDGELVDKNPDVKE